MVDQRNQGHPHFLGDGTMLKLAVFIFKKFTFPSSAHICFICLASKNIKKIDKVIIKFNRYVDNIHNNLQIIII